MPRILQLEAQRDEIKEEISALVAATRKDQRNLTDEEIQKSNDLQASLERIEATLNLERQQIETDRDVAATIEEPRRDEPVAKFVHVGEQLQAVYRGSDPRLMAATGLNEGVPSEGGYLVQSDFATELTNKAFQTGLLASRIRKNPIGANSNALKLNLCAETSRETTRYGGILTYWAGEAGVKTASQPTFRQWDYSLQKLIGLYYATDEVLQDATALQGVVDEWFGDEFGFRLDEAIYRGNGGNKPLGILNAPCLVTQTKEIGQAADTIVSQNIMKMYARMPSGSMSNAVWHINQECWPQIFQLSLAVGVGGVPMFIPGGGINSAPFGTLLGRPIVPLEQCSALGDVGDIAFCDWRQYLGITKGSIQSASSIHVKFVYDETAFRFVLRFNGAPIPNAPLTPHKGAATIGPFIVLEDR